MTWLKAALFTVAPHIGGIGGALITKSEVPTWYKTLVKPSWRPPNWLFGPVWTTLYSGMGYASYLVYRDGGGLDGEARLPLMLYGSQIMLNWAWTPIFFGAHRLGLAAVEILALWGNVAACIYTFHSVNRTASYLMVPYLAWLSLASALNWWIYLNNPSQKEKKDA